MSSPAGGWDDPVVGGTVLRIPQIASPNFSIAGQTGWAILQSGLAYFFNVILSGGTITGPDYIFNTQGLFFYSGAPAAGNLIISLAGPGVVTDPKGNAVIPNGLTVYGPAGNKAFIGLFGTSAALEFPSGAANEATPAILSSALIGAGAAQFIGTALASAKLSLAGHQDVVSLQANSPNAGGTSFANMAMNYFDNGGAQHTTGFWDANGLTISQGQYKPADGNSYTPGLMSLAVAANVPVATTGTVTLLSWLAQAGITYRVEAVVECLQGATASVQDLGIGGVTTAGPTRLFYDYIQDGAAQTFSNITNSGTIGFLASPAYAAARTFYLHIHGIITPASSGTLALVASCSVAADPFTVLGGSYVDVWQA